MNPHPSSHKSSIVQRIGRCFGWLPVAAVVAGTAACADAAPATNGRRPCAIGTYEITAIEATSLFGLERAGDTIAGTGGSMRFSIDVDGTWRLFDNGSENMRVTGGPITAQFAAKGAVEGRYESDGDEWTFTRERSNGAAFLRLPIVGTTRIPLSDARASLMPDGRASITCNGDRATMTSTPSSGPTVTVTLRSLPGQEGGS
jgi:hypothetical protein